MRELLAAIGEDPTRDGLLDTPARVARSYAELFAGLRQRPEDILTTTFDLGHDEIVLVKDIESVLDLRAPPRALPRGRARRLHPEHRRPDHRAVQAGPPRRRLRPAPPGAGAAHDADRRRADRASCSRAGAIVVLECEHLCMSMRGIRKPGARTMTSAVRGQLLNPATRAEAMSLILGR